MKAVVVKGIGEPKDVLVLSDMTDPPAPAQGQAIVRVRKRVVHPADYQAIRGILPGGMFASGGTPGIDGVGVTDRRYQCHLRDGKAHTFEFRGLSRLPAGGSGQGRRRSRSRAATRGDDPGVLGMRP